ncbi:MAG: glycosyltransferase [Prolixibacteraceae bacterium]|nr:glycosyltransferase [Prolixibacteraceae bacterium]MBN2773940.1 glycosyltransferase [Prolixibacteraceae bacterium]
MKGFNNYIELFGQFSFSELMLILFFAVILLIRFYFDLIFYGRVVFSRDRRIKNIKPSFSVLMTIRNEEKNLKENLPGLLNGEYLDFEVIVVDDFSQDQSYTILGLLKNENNKLKISSLNQDVRFSSKQALNIGLKAASKEWIIQTKPSVGNYPEKWISSFADKIFKKPDLIVGYSNIENQKGIFNLLYRIELFLQQFQSFAYIKNRCGFVVEEDNIAFKRQNYFDMGGFAREMNDEYLNLERLLNKMVKRRKVLLNLSREGVIRKKRFINPKKYRELIRKSIHIKKKLKFYKRLILGIDSFSKFIFLPLLIIVLFAFPVLFNLIAILVLSKVILHMFINYFMLNSLNEGKIFISSLIYELIIPFYRLVFIRNYISSARKR